LNRTSIEFLESAIAPQKHSSSQGSLSDRLKKIKNPIS
jgi:hypothetical protein